LADRAGEVILPHFREQRDVIDKGSGAFDPVTEADRGAEAAMRELIAAEYPDHGILGEEFDDRAGSSPYRWVLDPIDGTKAFICGLPVWGTLIGLLNGGRAVAGLMAQPFTGETYIGLDGTSIYRRNGESRIIRTSGVTDLKRAKAWAASQCSPNFVAMVNPRRSDPLIDFKKRPSRSSLVP
jgi:fructose-1,6-bisphosphatase/inositol monophosphatase family enzyme